MIQDIKRVITLKRYALLFSILFTAVFILYFYLLENSATGIIDFGSYYIYFDFHSLTSQQSSLAAGVILQLAFMFFVIWTRPMYAIITPTAMNPGP